MFKDCKKVVMVEAVEGLGRIDPKKVVFLLFVEFVFSTYLLIP